VGCSRCASLLFSLSPYRRSEVAMVSHREKWRSALARRLGPEALGDVIKMHDASGPYCGNWRRLSDPGGAAEYELATSIEIRCGDPSHPYAKTFLEYAIAIARRAYSEQERWSLSGDWGDPNGTPGIKRGILLTAKAYAEALETNRAPDRQELLEAARGMLADGSDLPHWDEYALTYYLVGVVLQVIAGELSEAKKAMLLRRRFRYNRPFRDWLKLLVDELSADNSERVIQPPVIAHFDRTFDVVRNPDWVTHLEDPVTGYMACQRTMLRLNLSLIRWRYIVGKPIAGHWDEVVDQIAA